MSQEKENGVLELDPESDFKNFQRVMKCLSCESRLKILQMLAERNLNGSEMAKILGLSEPNISAQVIKLQKANLLSHKYDIGEHGLQKICSPIYNTIIVKIPNGQKTTKDDWIKETEAKVSNKNRPNLRIIYPNGKVERYQAEDLNLKNIHLLLPSELSEIVKKKASEAYEREATHRRETE